MRKQLIKDLAPGTVINSVFLLTKKILKKKKNGEDFCIVAFQDKSGSIDGIIWTEACKKTDVLKKDRIKEGDFVNVKGFVSDYKESSQIDVSDISPIDPESQKDIDIKDYIKASKKIISEMFFELNSYVETIKDSFLQKLLKLFFEDAKFVEDFSISPAAVQYHHAYIGGLLEHTLSVASICNFLSGNYDNVDKDLIIAGAILHDVGKIDEYGVEKKGALIKITDRGKLLGHITIGYGMILGKINQIKDFPEELKQRLLHIILSHHGHKEFGSPKRPKTLEAFIVYHADHLDADVGGFNFILENSASSSDWSDYLRNFERSIYLKKKDYRKQAGTPVSANTKIRPAADGYDNEKFNDDSNDNEDFDAYVGKLEDKKQDGLF